MPTTSLGSVPWSDHAGQVVGWYCRHFSITATWPGLSPPVVTGAHGSCGFDMQPVYAEAR
jgi:hypothetical protein